MSTSNTPNTNKHIIISTKQLEYIKRAIEMGNLWFTPDEFDPEQDTGQVLVDMIDEVLKDDECGENSIHAFVL